MSGVIQSIFGKDVLQVGSCIKIIEDQEVHCYGLVLECTDRAIQIVEVTPEGFMTIREITLEEVIEQVYILEVFE